MAGKKKVLLQHEKEGLFFAVRKISQCVYFTVATGFCSEVHTKPGIV